MYRSEGCVLLPNLWTVLLDSAGGRQLEPLLDPGDSDMSFNKDEPKDIMQLNEINQSKKDKYYMIPLI